ncbi:MULTISPECIES: nitroreductase family protein [Pseudomonas]|uniref:Nitroreductase n=1 Tax=Pseudomonas luteola TaxID=47886 RepID=A0A2X2CL84_PSELU|nr:MULTISPECIES: nitroreductase family protein [Pseudomonas]ENA37560.1 hypothetical protein HMPREF1487_04483 [Pseudomonas sp. HPB0071]MBF8642395.1 nitroreductase family protein [Pseudomonas zeshuii]RRW48229.1 nitroreductase family protein [Pseudomonas luteola]SHJ21439.1 Nitroreductase [Pseudomonas zeshuii]SPZ07803.1 nitroreductase [Pseudomonas luteola]
MTASTRVPQYEVDPQFVQRWSPRAFSDAAIEENQLMSIFEAARWAPSAYNAQPWRFLYARRGSAHWDTFLKLISEYNRSWAQHAAALVIVLSKTTFVPPGGSDEVPLGSHSFDTGAAWGFMSLQAGKLGFHTHGMAGIEYDLIRQELKVPTDLKIEMAIAIGKLGDKSSLSEKLQARELPSPRRPVEELAAEGPYTLG